MPRKSTKTTENTVSAIDEAINTPVNFQFCEVAEELGIGEAELRERLEDKKGNAEVHQMDSIPVEWEPAIKAIKIDLEAEASVRRLDAATEPPIPQAQAQEEPPIIEDEPQPKKRGGKGKKDSTALTKGKQEAMEKKEQQAGNLSQSVTEIKRTIKRQKGAKSGAELAAIELAAEEMIYHAVTDQKLRRDIAIHGIEMAQGFDHIEYLQESGLVGEGDLLDNLRTDAEELLGKYEIATQEIVNNSTLNGFSLEESEALLNELLNSKKSA